MPNTIDAVRQAVREAGGMSRYLADEAAQVAIHGRLAEALRVSPAEIDAAEIAICDRLKELGAIALPMVEAGARVEDALNNGDDELCHDLFQQIADHLLACGYKARNRKKLPCKA
jgi:hypothetical protein